jgi:RNA-directed DNA polymerase
MSEPLATYEWRTLPWRTLEVAVLKLQRRIYKASQARDIRRVHRLQRLLLTSRAAKLLAVRRVTQDNQGKHTAGIDGVKSLTPPQRLALAERLGKLPTGSPTRRVWIPKPGKAERRPLGIPTLHDRALQALVKLVMEPEWEATFEPNSYGFRPGRSGHDAIGAIFIAIDKQPKYVLDADIAKCFDRIDHQALLRKTGTPPHLRRLLRSWLQAGVLDQGVFAETEAGTPQGAVASPLLANIALHGLETHIRAQFPGKARSGRAGERVQVRWKPQVIRYGDDFVVLHRDKAVIEYCQRLAEEWLQGIGLELNRDKTRIAHTLEYKGGQAGFNFLGFEVRQHPVSRYNAKRGFKTLIKPSKDAIQRHGAQLSAIIARNKAARQTNLIGLLNPVIAGWSNYYSAVVSKAVFQSLDNRLYLKLARWARYRHPRKSRHWIVQRYWRTDQGHGWVFAANDGLTLNRHADVPIVRHRKVRDTASPFNGDWRYWAARRGSYPGIPRRVATLLKRQDGRCHHCGLFFTPQALLEVHHLNRDRRINAYINLAAVHRHCHDQIHGGPCERSSAQGTHDKSPIDRGAVCLERGTHGFADQWGERSPH